MTDKIDCIRNMQDRIMEITHSEQQKGKQIIKERTVSGTSGIISSILIFSLQGSWRENREKGVENVFDETMAGKFLNLKKKQISTFRTQKVSNKMSPKRFHTKMHHNQIVRDLPGVGKPQMQRARIRPWVREQDPQCHNLEFTCRK